MKKTRLLILISLCSILTLLAYCWASDLSLSLREKDADDVIEGVVKDSRGIYGYLPKVGSRYYKFYDNFMDAEWVAKNRQIRIKYLEESKELKKIIATMRAQDKSAEEIARKVVAERNSQKVKARKSMPPEEVKKLEDGNIKKYGNPIGPTADDLFSKKGDWEAIIQNSMKKDPEINRLLGIE